MDAEHRERLSQAGVDVEVLDDLDLVRVDDDWDPWWHEHENVLYAVRGAELPRGALERMTGYPFSRALVVLASPLEHLVSLLVGDDATVFIGAGCVLTAAEIYCGPQSQVVLHGPLTATRCAVVDARNGGSVVVGPDGLWAAVVYVATDDMHRLGDRSTGERLNPYGAHVRIGRHVWLCKDAVVTGHAHVGDGAVVGMRSVVRNQEVAAHTAVAGVPARVVRKDVEWDEQDRP